MPEKKMSHLLHRRINELLDQLLAKSSGEESSQPQSDLPKPNAPDSKPADSEPTNAYSAKLNLGIGKEDFHVDMESFFQFNFDVSQELDRFVEEKMLDDYQREWDLYNFEKARMAPHECRTTTEGIPKRPK